MEPNSNVAQIGAEITRLRKSGKVKEALVLGEKEILNYSDNWQIRGALAWVIYTDVIKNAIEGQIQPLKIRDAVKRIRDLTSHGLYGEISAYVLATLKGSELLNSSNSSIIAMELLSEVDFAQLSKESSRFEGKQVPSHAARWFLQMSETLLELERFVELESICSKALSSEVFKNEGERKWIRYRRALSLETINPLEAINEIDRFLESSNDWWAFQVKARLLQGLGQTDEAQLSYRRALGRINMKDLEFAVNLLLGFSEIAVDVEVKKDLVQSVRALRVSKNWKSDSRAEQLAIELGLKDPSDFNFRAAVQKIADSSDPQSSKRIHKQVDSGKVVVAEAHAVVKKLLDGNKHGFVTVNGIGDCYFRGTDNPKLVWPPSIGAKIIGRVIESFDSKKNVSSKRFMDGMPEA